MFGEMYKVTFELHVWRNVLIGHVWRNAQIYLDMFVEMYYF